MIELKNINKTYKSKHISVNALQEVSLTLPDKGLVFIVGKSGCGKTTLLNVLGGLDKFDSGEFTINGKSANKYRSSDWDKYRNSFVGLVFQENNLLEEYNVYENVRLATDLQGSKSESDTVSNALKYVGLDGYQKRNINELSGGQKQRAAIARAIAKSSKLLLADEPTGSLDESTGKDIFELLKKLSETQLVVVVTHDTDSAKTYGDMLIEMSDGRITKTTTLSKNNIDEQITTYNTVKSRLKPRVCFLLATRAFKRVPLRLAVLVLLCMFGFSLMTGALKFTLWQPYDLQKQVLETEGRAIVTRTPNVVKSGGMAYGEQRFFDAAALADFKNTFPDIEAFSVVDTSQRYNMNMFRELTERQRVYYDNAFNGEISMDSDGLESFGIELLAGEMPSSSWGEFDVAISEYYFEMYTMLNYKENGLELEIIKYEDLIGKKIENGEYTIRGVLDTHFDREEYSFVKEYALSQSDNFSVDWTSAFTFYSQKGFHNLLFRSPNYSSGQDSMYLAIPYDESVFAESNFIRAIFDSEEYRFSDYYSYILKFQSGQSVSFGNIMTWIAVVAIAFAVLLFVNFISISILDKMRQIGILRALGASKGNIAAIFILQNILIALIVFVCSGLTVNFAMMPLLLLMGTTHTFPFPWYSMVFTDYIVLLGLVVVTSVIASLLPLIKLIKKTPREIITAGR